MRALIDREIEIEDLLGHPADMVAELRAELSGNPSQSSTLSSPPPPAGANCCANMTPDPKRLGFYEVRAEMFTYYIHVMPSSGKVLLLAAWPTPEC